MARSFGRCLLTFLQTAKLFSKWFYHFTSLVAVYESFCPPIPSPTPGMANLYTFSHSSLYDVVSHCGLNLHLLNDKFCWASFHVLFVLFCLSSLVSTQVFCIFFNRLYAWIYGPFWVNFYVWSKAWSPSSFFSIQYPITLAPFPKKAILSLLNCLYNFVKNQLPMNVWVFF